MDKTPIEMIEILPIEQFELAKEFVNLGERLKCKFQVRFARAHKTWKCVMSRSKPSRVLFTIECTEAKWHIKACLWSIDTYREVLEKSSDTIKDIVKKAFNCKLCNIHCNGGACFTLDGLQYRKCLGCGFYFQNLNQDDWYQLLSLLEKEYEATNPAV